MKWFKQDILAIKTPQQQHGLITLSFISGQEKKNPTLLDGGTRHLLGMNPHNAFTNMTDPSGKEEGHLAREIQGERIRLIVGPLLKIPTFWLTPNKRTWQHYVAPPYYS